MEIKKIPFYVRNKGELSTKIALLLTNVPQKNVVRFTGGCGGMDKKDAEDINELFAEAFQGYAGAMLDGGVRMLRKHNLKEIVPGITEPPVAIRARSPRARLIGIAPRTEDFSYYPEAGIVIAGEAENDYVTIMHPVQDQCLVVQKSVDEPATWEIEYEESLRIMAHLKSLAGFGSLTVSFNGGLVTEKEILATAKLGWPILLVRGSGRKTDEYANNDEFLAKYPNVRVADKDPQSIRRELVQLGAIQIP